MYHLPELQYDYDALGSYISKDIMQLHHSKHHQAYVDKLNAAIDQAPALRERPLTVDALYRDAGLAGEGAPQFENTVVETGGSAAETGVDRARGARHR